LILIASGIIKSPLDPNTANPATKTSNTPYSRIINDALNNSVPMNQALNQLTNLVENNKEEACKVLTGEPRIGEFLLAAGCALVS